jgi:exopolyphosphatase/guanosine-5'-triphosphate,3'-diphosphate pyrophosphatase
MDDMRLSAIDLGSNSAILLIADVEMGKSPLIIDEDMVTTCLGRGVGKNGVITPKAQGAALSALTDFSQRMDANKVEATLALATGLLTNAGNWLSFSEKIYTKTGLKVSLISSKQEAELSFLSATCSLGLSGEVAVLDIGAGTVQLSIGEGSCARESISFPLGSLRLTEQFILGAPTGDAEIVCLRESIRQELTGNRPAWLAEIANIPLIVVGGTAVALSALKLGLDKYDREAIQGTELTTEDITSAVSRLSALSREGRKKLMSFEPGRAPIILAGVVVLAEFLRHLGKESVQVCWWGLSYGMIIRLAEILAEE